MWNNRDDDPGRPRPPRVEPEILPPVRDGGARQHETPDQAWTTRQRVFVAPSGPAGAILGLLALGALAALGVVAFLGFFLLLVPAIGAFAVVLILAALLRGPRRL